MELGAAVATFERLGAVPDAMRAIATLTRLEGAVDSEMGATRTVRRAS